MDKSRAFSKIMERIKSNAYKTNRVQKVENKQFLRKTRSRLLSKKDELIRYKEGHKGKLEKLDALLERLSDPGLNSPDTGTVWINETLSQGDCFFSSLYRAFKERDLLSTVTRLLPNLRSSTELRFVGSFRNLIADEVLANRLPFNFNQHGQREDTYDFYAGMGPSFEAAVAYDEVLPDWFKKGFSKGIKTRAHFLKVCAKAIRTRQEYVGELEVEIAKRLLKDIGIILEIEGQRRTVLPKARDSLPLVVLYNESGGHYEYYSFSDRCKRKGTVRNPVSRQCHTKCKDDEERLPPYFTCAKTKKAKKNKASS